MSERGERRRIPWLRLLWQVGITVLFVTLATQTIDLDEVTESVARADLRWVVPSLSLFTLAKFIDSWRWRFLLRRVARVPQRGLFAAFLIGNMVNNLLPLRAGDLAKIQLLGRRYEVPRSAVAASIFVVEATLDGVVFLLFIGVALLTWGPLVLANAQQAALLGVVALAVVAFTFAVLLSRRWQTVIGWLERLPESVRDRVMPLVEHMSEGMAVLRDWRSTGIAIALSIPAWLVEATMFAGFGQAFGFDLPWVTYLAAMVAANMATAVPLALWNIGPYEVLVSGVLVASGVDDAPALSYAVTVHLATIAWIQFTGLLAFWALRVHPRELLVLRAPPPSSEPRQVQ